MRFFKNLLAGFLVSGGILSATAQPSSFAPIIEKTAPSVVEISVQLADEADSPEVINHLLFTTSDGRTALGAGFVLDTDGHIATNWHVLENSKEITVKTSDARSFSAEIIGHDQSSDLAVIKIDSAAQLPPVSWAKTNDSKVGDWILAAGNPFGLGISFTAGIISARNRLIGTQNSDLYLQTDAALSYGFSGGPMFNTAGEVIGINTAIFSTDGSAQGVGLALEAANARAVLNRLTQNAENVSFSIPKPRLKPKIKQQTSSQYYPEAGIHLDGRKIAAVEKGSEAAQKGIAAGDEIVKINNHLFSNSQDFRFYIHEAASTHSPLHLQLKNNQTGEPYAAELHIGALAHDTD